MIVRSKQSLNVVVKCKPSVHTPGLYETHRIICSVRNMDRDGVVAVAAATILDVACGGRDRLCGIDIVGEY